MSEQNNTEVNPMYDKDYGDGIRYLNYGYKGAKVCVKTLHTTVYEDSVIGVISEAGIKYRQYTISHYQKKENPVEFLYEIERSIMDDETGQPIPVFLSFLSQKELTIDKVRDIIGNMFKDIQAISNAKRS
ncbi:MAG: hypothetical protein HPY53_11225 [Brevinematales bacterium]|nr:hypothetical protein [Brevinematales bacterium]